MNDVLIEVLATTLFHLAVFFGPVYVAYIVTGR